MTRRSSRARGTLGAAAIREGRRTTRQNDDTSATLDERRTRRIWRVPAACPGQDHFLGAPGGIQTYDTRFGNEREHVSSSRLQSRLTYSACIVIPSGFVEHHAEAGRRWTSGCEQIDSIFLTAFRYITTRAEGTSEAPTGCERGSTRPFLSLGQPPEQSSESASGNRSGASPSPLPAVIRRNRVPVASVTAVSEGDGGRGVGEEVGDAVLDALQAFLDPAAPAVDVGEPRLVGRLSPRRPFGDHGADQRIGGRRADGLLASHREADDADPIAVDLGARGEERRCRRRCRDRRTSRSPSPCRRCRRDHGRR